MGKMRHKGGTVVLLIGSHIGDVHAQGMKHLLDQGQVLGTALLLVAENGDFPPE